MSTIQELIDEIIEETRRVDKTVLITSYVKKAIQHAHSLKDFKRDRLDTTVAVTDGPKTVGTVILPDNFKKAKLVRPLINGILITGEELSEIFVEDLVSRARKGTDLETYYITGNNLTFKSSRSLTEIGLIYQAWPDLTLSNSTWVTQKYPEGLKDLCKSYIFAVSGDKENAANLMSQWLITATDINNTED